MFIDMFDSNSLNQVSNILKFYGYNNIGFWIEEGFIYVDPYFFYEDKEVALSYATLLKEKAIWDSINNEAIQIK